MRTKNGKTKCKKAVNLLAVSGLAVVLTFTSCNKDDSIGEEVIAAEEQQTPLLKKYFLGDEVLVKKEEDGTFSLAGSDTRLFENQLSDTPEYFDEYPRPDESMSNLALAGGVRKWTNNTVAYVIRGLSSSVRSELQKSINEWTNKTNVSFVQRTNQSNYVTISSSGSKSNSGIATLGMNGSRGYIRLGTRATAEVIIHELGHT
ncbi:MAG: M12 family metallopeptidase, partial [Aurantibacter sp.]